MQFATAVLLEVFPVLVAVSTRGLQPHATVQLADPGAVLLLSSALALYGTQCSTAAAVCQCAADAHSASSPFVTAVFLEMSSVLVAVFARGLQPHATVQLADPGAVSLLSSALALCGTHIEIVSSIRR